MTYQENKKFSDAKETLDWAQALIEEFLLSIDELRTELERQNEQIEINTDEDKNEYKRGYNQCLLDLKIKDEFEEK